MDFKLVDMEYMHTFSHNVITQSSYYDDWMHHAFDVH